MHLARARGGGESLGGELHSLTGATQQINPVCNAGTHPPPLHFPRTRQPTMAAPDADIEAELLAAGKELDKVSRFAFSQRRC